MGDTIIKLRVLIVWLRNAYAEWRKEVWSAELDARYCCDGYECGCEAATVREMFCWNLGRDTTHD